MAVHVYKPLEHEKSRPKQPKPREEFDKQDHVFEVGSTIKLGERERERIAREVNENNGENVDIKTLLEFVKAESNDKLRRRAFNVWTERIKKAQEEVTNDPFLRGKGGSLMTEIKDNEWILKLSNEVHSRGIGWDHVDRISKAGFTLREFENEAKNKKFKHDIGDNFVNNVLDALKASRYIG